MISKSKRFRFHFEKRFHNENVFISKHFQNGNVFIYKSFAKRKCFCNESKILFKPI